MGRRNNKRRNSQDKKPVEKKPEENKRASGTQGDASTSSSSEKAVNEDQSKAGGQTNDVAWYSKFPELLADAARVPFTRPFGSNLDIFHSAPQYATTLSPASTLKHQSITGVICHKIKPTVGLTVDAKSPINVAANMLYVHTRFTNSGRKNYDPVDLGIYTLTIADLYSFLMWCQRTYALAYSYSAKNQYWGQCLLQVEGIDVDDIVTNLPNFRYWINVITNKIAVYALPEEITLIHRRAFMYSSVYLENAEGNIKDQMYLNSPDGFYRFDLDAAGAGCLHYFSLKDRIADHKLKFADFRTIADVLLANIWGDEDFGLLSGDLLRAFEGRMVSIAPVEEDITIVPLYDKMVLSQFKNSTISPLIRPALSATTPTIVDSSTTYDHVNPDGTLVPVQYGCVYQDPKGIIYTREGILAGAFNYVVPASNPILSLEDAIPDSGAIIEGTRMLTCLDTSETTNISGTLVTGTEVVVEEIVAYNAASDNVNTFTLTAKHHEDNFVYKVNGLNNTTEVNLDRIGAKYAALGYFVEVDSAAKIANFAIKSNVDNYAILNEDILKRMHETAIISMLAVPGVAKMVNLM